MSRADHMDVAAYALGVLDEQDTERFEEHLATCWACAAELETMVPVVGLLSDIDGETMVALEQTATDPALLDRTLVAVRTHRRQARFRQVLATAAAVVAVGALSGVGVATFGGTAGGDGPVIAEPSRSDAGGPGRRARSRPGRGRRWGAPRSRATSSTPPTRQHRGAGHHVAGEQGVRHLDRVHPDAGCPARAPAGWWWSARTPPPRCISTWAVPGRGYGTNRQPAESPAGGVHVGAARRHREVAGAVGGRQRGGESAGDPTFPEHRRNGVDPVRVDAVRLCPARRMPLLAHTYGWRKRFNGSDVKCAHCSIFNLDSGRSVLLGEPPRMRRARGTRSSGRPSSSRARWSHSRPALPQVTTGRTRARPSRSPSPRPSPPRRSSRRPRRPRCQAPPPPTRRRPRPTSS